MKVLSKGKMPNGEGIQIEDWSADYTIHSYGDVIAAFPRKKNPGRPDGCSYRAECQFASYEEAKAAFDSLVAGSSSLDDYKFTSLKAGNRIPFRKYTFI